MVDSVAASVSSDAMLSFLREPDSYPYTPESVRVIQTHASYVALAPPYVYKVKKPVNLGFLDFSSLHQQRRFSREEIRLNRRLCPHLYEGLVPITKREGQLKFYGSGAVVAYAIRMKHLEDGYFMHQLLDRKVLTRGDVDRVVEKLARLYEGQVPSEVCAAWGRSAVLKVSTEENFRQAVPFIGRTLSTSAFETIKQYTNRFFEQHAALINQRRQSGRIVDGHGDLHLEHIHITPERIQIYDCIEFNERFRYIDIASDVAFLAMDLDRKERPEEARYFVQCMAQRLGDPKLLQMLDFYKCYRAFVRGKVESITSTESEVPAKKRAESREKAKTYFRLSLRYALTGSGPLVIVVMGRIGAGKSTQAEALAEELGWPHLASDRIRKTQLGLPLYQRTPEADRPRVYAPDQTRRTYQALSDNAVRYAEKGQGVVLDATFGNRAHRDALRSMLNRRKIPYIFVELTVPSEQVRMRLAARGNEDQVVSDARLEDWPHLNARYDAPGHLEDAHHIQVKAQGDVPDVTRQIFHQISCIRHSDRR